MPSGIWNPRAKGRRRHEAAVAVDETAAARLEAESEARTSPGGIGLESGGLLNPKPERSKVERIVNALDTDRDGTVSAAEIVKLLSRMLGIPEAQIPADHEDVAQLIGLENDALTDKLVESVNRIVVDKYHATLFPEVPEEEGEEGQPPLLRSAALDTASLSQGAGPGTAAACDTPDVEQSAEAREELQHQEGLRLAEEGVLVAREALAGLNREGSEADHPGLLSRKDAATKALAEAEAHAVRLRYPGVSTTATHSFKSLKASRPPNEAERERQERGLGWKVLPIRDIHNAMQEFKMIEKPRQKGLSFKNLGLLHRRAKQQHHRPQDESTVLPASSHLEEKIACAVRMEMRLEMEKRFLLCLKR